MKSRGYDFERLVTRVSAALGIEPSEVVTCSKRKNAVPGRNLACFWACRELGMSQIELAEKFGVSQPAVSAAVKKGERMVREKGYGIKDDD
ncbi:MAG: helix-turn-helix domain-containing protein [Desulfobacterales bacterium]